MSKKWLILPHSPLQLQHCMPALKKIPRDHQEIVLLLTVITMMSKEMVAKLISDRRYLPGVNAVDICNFGA